MVDDDDDKYNKKKALPVPKFTTRQTTTSSLTPDGKTRKERSMGGGLGGQSSKSAQNSPQNQFDSNRLAAKLDFLSARVNFDGEEETQTKVHNALDRLSFATQVHHTADAFGQALTDAKEEVGEYALKAAESVARFQATQYAAKWMPLETNVNLKPTYVKVPVSTVERLKFYEDENVRQIVAQHLIEKETILAENAGLRSLVPGLQDEVSSEQVANIRETEDGVNRALLLAAVEEIAKLKTRVTVLEGEAAKHRVTSAGFGLIGVNASEHSGEIAEHARKLTTELARGEEDNGRQKWLIGEKDKEIETIKGKFMDTYQYSLEERLQESTEALEVAAMGLQEEASQRRRALLAEAAEEGRERESVGGKGFLEDTEEGKEDDEGSLSDSDDGCPRCRICYEKDGELLRPCDCDGSMAFVHGACLGKWLKAQAPMGVSRTCDVCRSPWKVVREPTVGRFVFEFVFEFAIDSPCIVERILKSGVERVCAGEHAVGYLW